MGDGVGKGWAFIIFVLPLFMYWLRVVCPAFVGDVIGRSLSKKWRNRLVMISGIVDILFFICGKNYLAFVVLFFIFGLFKPSMPRILQKLWTLLAIVSFLFFIFMTLAIFHKK